MRAGCADFAARGLIMKGGLRHFLVASPRAFSANEAATAVRHKLLQNG